MTDHDQYIQSQVDGMLQPGEKILHFSYMLKQPGLIWQMLLIGGLLLFLVTKAYYVVLTNRRLLFIRTKQGLFKPQLVNNGVDEIAVGQLVKCTTSGFANNRSMTFHLSDGSSNTLRISPWFKFVSGTKAFFDQVPQLIGSPELMSGGAAAGQLGPGAGR